MIGVSRRTLYELIAERQLVSPKLRGRRLITKSALERLLTESEFIDVSRSSSIVGFTAVSGINSDRNGAMSVLLTHGGRDRISRTGYQNLKPPCNCCPAARPLRQTVDSLHFLEFPPAGLSNPGLFFR